LGSYGFLKCFFNLGYNFNDKILLYYGHASNTVKIINYLNFLSSNYNFKSLVPKKNKNDFSLNHVYKFLNILNSYKPKLIIAFPSHIFRIAQLIWINNIELQYTPYCMDLSAEFLFTCQYKFIKEIFKNCDIRLSYGTVEFGQIAQQTKEDIRLYEVFDEIVDIRNNEKNQFIITSYILTTQPLINYLVDDYGIVFKKNGKTYIKNLVGKKSKCLTDDKFDLIKIDNIINKINKIELIIIDVKIKYLSKKIHIIILKNINNKKKKYIKSQFIDNLGINNNYNFIFDLCLNYKCPNIVNFNIKVNAIICE
jgi:phenylacetate-coenzyme A ligase PaaK-like adenylate-forming protein